MNSQYHERFSHNFGSSDMGKLFYSALTSDLVHADSREELSKLCAEKIVFHSEHSENRESYSVPP